jgi:hypothetical protein
MPPGNLGAVRGYMANSIVTTKPKGVMLVFAYAIAVPIWLLSAPFIIIGDLSAWTARRRHTLSNDIPS